MQAYQNAVSQFQIGHQLEQENRQRASDPYRLALQFAPQIQPGQRGGFISEALGKIGEQENQPFAYGPDQLNQIQQSFRHLNPNAAAFPLPSLPAGNNPWVPQMPPQGAFDQGQPPPQAPPQAPPPANTAPLIAATPQMLEGFGTVLGQPRSQTTPLTPDQMAQNAVGAGAPFTATPPMNPLGNELTYATNQQFPGQPGLQSPNQMLGPAANPAAFLNQQAFGPALQQAMQTVQNRQQGVMDTAGAQGGASGSNPQATQPPNTRGQAPDLTPASFAPGAGAGAVPQAGAPPPSVPPSASVGTAPVTVPGAGGQPSATAAGGPAPNVLHIPGFSRDYAYGEVDQRAQTQAVTRRQAAIAHLRDINAPPETLQQVQDLIGRAGSPDTQAGLQQYDFATQQIEALGVGQGSAIYRVRLAAKRTSPNLIGQFMSVVGKSRRGSDPTWLNRTALSMGIDPALATQLASGDFSDPEIKKLLDSAVNKIYTPGFNKLPIETQNSLLQAAQGYADTLHVPIELPPAVIEQMTPYQREQLDLQRVRVQQGGRAQDIAEARYQLAHWKLQAQIDGLLGGGAGGKGGKLTANAQLYAARQPYDEAIKTQRALRADTKFAGDRNKYDEAKNNLLAKLPDYTPEQELAAIDHIIADPRTSDKARILANNDKHRLKASQFYQRKVGELVQAGEQPAGAPGQRTVVPTFSTGGGKAVSAPAGVAAPGQAAPSAPVPMIFTSPTGQKQLFSRDPGAIARYLLGKNPGWTMQQAQRKVQQMIQEAKHGRVRAR